MRGSNSVSESCHKSRWVSSSVSQTPVVSEDASQKLLPAPLSSLEYTPGLTRHHSEARPQEKKSQLVKQGEIYWCWPQSLHLGRLSLPSP